MSKTNTCRIDVFFKMMWVDRGLRKWALGRCVDGAPREGPVESQPCRDVASLRLRQRQRSPPIGRISELAAPSAFVNARNLLCQLFGALQKSACCRCRFFSVCRSLRERSQQTHRSATHCQCEEALALLAVPSSLDVIIKESSSSEHVHKLQLR